MSEDKENQDLHNIISFADRLWSREKWSHNGLWFRKQIDLYDHQYPDVFDDTYVSRVEDSFRLMSGDAMLNFSQKAKSAAAFSQYDLVSEGIDKQNLELSHFDSISPIVERQFGDRKKRFLRFAVTDSSLFTQNYIKQFREDQLRNVVEEKILNPARQIAAMQWQMENGVEDLFQLDPQQRQQFEADLNSRVESLIPKDVFNFTKKGAAGSVEEVGQRIAEALVSSLRLKYTFDEAYKESFATDAAIFYTGVRRNKPFLELVDPTKFNTGGANNFFIDDNPWFKRIMSKHPVTIWNEYSGEWDKGDIKKFGELVRLQGGTSEEAEDENIALRIDFAGKEMLNNTNLLTKEGQAAYPHFLHRYGSSGVDNYDNLRVCHVVWSSLEPMRRITKNYGDGVIGYEWFNEDYEFNPANGDLEMVIKWVQRYYQGEKIGQGENAIYANIGPVPYSRRDITDPYISKSPFTGGWYNDLRGKGAKKSSIDRCKEYVHNINFQMRVIRDQEATDIGKVVLMTVAAKPKGWSWGKLIEVVRATKLLPINTGQNGLTAMDVQFFKEIDLSNLNNIIPRINYLQYLFSRIGEIMADNPARSGMQAASTSVSNNMSNLQRSFSQTAGRDGWLDTIIERTLENLIYLGKRSAKNGNIFLRYALDDLSIETIDIDVAEIDDAYYGVRVQTDDLALSQVDIGKDLLMPYIQGKGLSYRLAIETLTATTRGELLNIANEAELMEEIRNAQAQQFQAQSAQQAAEMQLQYEKDILELKSNLKKVEDSINNEAKKEMAALQSMTLAHGNDVNKDGINDYTETADKNRQVKMAEVLIKDQLERDKLALEDKWNTQELAILAEEISQMEKIAMIKEAKKPPKAKK